MITLIKLKLTRYLVKWFYHRFYDNSIGEASEGKYITIGLLNQTITDKWRRNKKQLVGWQPPKLSPIKRDETIKILHKTEPTTYREKRLKAIKDNKPIIKTFHK